jgi:hypothetical protein
MRETRIPSDWSAPSLMHRMRVVGDRITYVGLDVHNEGIVVAIAEGSSRGKAREYGRIANTATALDRLMRWLRFCYEEGRAAMAFTVTCRRRPRVIIAQRARAVL